VSGKSVPEITPRFAILILVPLLVTGCTSDSGTPPADLAFVNARVYTVDNVRPWAEAVVVRDGKIVFVGDARNAATHIGDGTDVRDLSGKLVLPGFIDSHMHLFDSAKYANALELTIDQTIDEWVSEIARHARENPNLPVLFGYGFLATTFGPTGPTRQLIDTVVPDRPVLIMDEGFHAAWANTAALDMLNVTRDTPDPAPGFSYYKRDRDGEATGYILEGAAIAAAEIFASRSEDDVVAGMVSFIDLMNRYGITAAFDAGAQNDEAGDVAPVLRRVEEAGELTLRVVGSAYTNHPALADVAVERALRWGELVRGQRYRYDTLKISYDGTIESRSAAMFEEYQGEPGNSGATVYTEEQLVAMISGAAARGIDVHVHSLGDRAIRETLDAIETVRQKQADSATRYTITHLEVIDLQDISRFAELGVIAQTSPVWFAYDDLGKQFLNEDQFNRYWLVGSLKNSDARLTFGSDHPATGLGAFGMHPLLGIEMGMTRQTHGEPDALIQPPASERLDIETMIRGYTIDGAYQLQMEDQIGSIKVGKKADLIVLDQDIFEIDTYSIHKTEVLLTVLDGEIVHEL
jgi:predicted amidohydrolase YtcJ